MEKRGISAIIATVMIILTAVTAVAITWLVIIPIISSANLNTEIDLKLISGKDHTLWDSENRLVAVQVQRNEDESDVIGFDIVFEMDGSSVTHFISKMPGTNSKSVYYINLTNYQGDLNSINLVPIFKGGVIGSISSELKVNKTSI